MPEKPSFAGEYTSEQVELVKATCLYVATKLHGMSQFSALKTRLVTNLSVMV